MKFIFLFFLLINTAFAGDLHLGIAGGGNVSSFQVNNSGLRFIPGVNFKTDLGYYFGQWAVEWSTQVKFGQFKDFLIWDTLLTAGVRYQFTGSPHFMRVFAGRSPTVLFLRTSEISEGEDASRFLFLGEVYGTSFGKMFKTEKGTNWFIEGALTYQRLGSGSGVKDTEDAPVEVPIRSGTDRLEIFGLYLMVGMWVF